MQTRPLLLLLEDDFDLAHMIQLFFEREEFSVEIHHSGAAALEALRAAPPDRYQAALLDVQVPGMDGFAVLQNLRKFSDLPVIMLTARAAVRDRIQGLTEGADDYLPKPFDAEELLARLRSVLRRTRAANQSSHIVVEASGVRLDKATRRAMADGAEMTLTSLEFDILSVLVQCAGRVVSRDELTQQTHNRALDPLDRSLDVHVSHLRKKLPQGDDLIRTIRGVGYQFEDRES